MADVNANYEIVFEDVHGYKVGDVVPGTMLGGTESGLDYLLSVGAIQSTAKQGLIKTASASVQGQIDAATTSLREDIVQLQEDLIKAKDEIETLAKDKVELQKEIDVLKARAI